MKTIQRIVVIFASSLVVARLVDMLLRSNAGKQMARSAGLNSLLTEAGVETAKRYSKTATGLLVGTVLAVRNHQLEQYARQDSDLVHRAENAAELAVAAGTLAKIVADFLREEQEMRRTERAF